MPQKIKAIIVDIDGTLSCDSWRRQAYDHPKRDWDEINAMCKYDKPNLWCKELVRSMSEAGYQIIFLTARNSKARDITESWLNDNLDSLHNSVLMMRPENDFRADYIIKEMIYRKEIEPHYEVLFCVEDKQSVTDMWRKIGVVCLQCEGNPV